MQRNKTNEVSMLKDLTSMEDITIFKGQKELVAGSGPIGKGASWARVVRQGHLAWVCVAYIKVLTPPVALTIY